MAKARIISHTQRDGLIISVDSHVVDSVAEEIETFFKDNELNEIVSNADSKNGVYAIRTIWNSGKKTIRVLIRNKINATDLRTHFNKYRSTYNFSYRVYNRQGKTTLNWNYGATITIKEL